MTGVGGSKLSNKGYLAVECSDGPQPFLEMICAWEAGEQVALGLNGAGRGSFMNKGGTRVGQSV